MKIAIQGHPTRGKEIIQILESLGGKNTNKLYGDAKDYIYHYHIDNSGAISFSPKYDLYNHKLYTLEEFEKEFPFKVGDKVTDHEGDVAIITGFAYIEEKLGYSLQYENGRGIATPRILKPYKEMKEKRNITLTLDKAKEWYNKGGELKEIALQAFSEKELNPLPRSWEEFCEKYPLKETEAVICCDSSIVDCKGLGEKRDSEYYKDICPSKKSAEAHLAMIQLEQLRDCWRQDWKPNWLDDTLNYVIQGWRDTYSVESLQVTHKFLSFPTYKMAKEFLECFKDLIEKAGDLI